MYEITLFTKYCKIIHSNKKKISNNKNNLHLLEILCLMNDSEYNLITHVRGK